VGGNLAAASLLLTYGAATDAVDMHSCTPLHWAAHCGHHDIAALLLISKASIDVCHKNGMTPLLLKQQQQSSVTDCGHCFSVLMLLQSPQNLVQSLWVRLYVVVLHLYTLIRHFRRNGKAHLTRNLQESHEFLMVLALLLFSNKVAVCGSCALWFYATHLAQQVGNPIPT
jgi:hypothetical protein